MGKVGGLLPQALTRLKPRMRRRAAFVLGLLLACTPCSSAQEKPSATEPPTQLELGKTIEDVLAPDQTKSFQVMVAAGQFAEIVIQGKEGIQLGVHFLTPEGKDERAMDRSFGDLITMVILASTGGTYRVNVRRFGKLGGEGHYQISLLQLRTAVPDDEKRVAAERAHVQGTLLDQDRSAQGLRTRLEKYQTALSLWRQVDDRRNEAVALLRIGEVYSDLREGTQALEHLQQALTISQELGLRAIAAETLMSLGSTYRNQGNLQKAVEYYRQALVMSREIQDKYAEAFVVMALARNDSSVDALEYFQRGLDLYRTLGDPRGEAYALNMLGQKYVALGRQKEGMESLRQSIEVSRAHNNRYEESYALLHLADGYAMQGEMRKALDLYLQALPLQRARGDSWGEAQALSQTGLMYKSLGEMDKALEYSRQALPLWQKVQSRDEEAAAFIDLGSAYSALGDTETASAQFQSALIVYRALSDHSGEARTFSAIGNNHVRQAKLQDALQDYNQAMAIYRAAAGADSDMRLGEAIVLRNLGSVEVSLGMTDEALKSLNQARELLAATGHSIDDEASILYELARAERAAKHLPEALDRIKAALDLTERQRSGVGGTDLRVSYVASVRDRYELLIALLMQLHQQRPHEGYDTQGLEVSERARARGLLDLLTESHADIRQGVDPALLEQERSLRAALTFKAAYRIQLLSKTHTAQQASDLEKEISAINSQYEETEAKIRASSPHYAGLTQPQPLTLPEIQLLLGPGTALLEYSLGADKSFLWVVTAESLSSYELPKRAEIEALARRAYAELSINNPAAGQAAIIALGRMLLGLAEQRPAEQQLAGKRLVIVAEGALEYIPFVALRTSQQGAPLVVGHEVVNLPSASTLALLRKETEGRTTPPKQVAVLADPVFSRDDPRVSGAPTGAAYPPGKGEVSHSTDVERSARETGLLSLDRLPASRSEAQTIIALAGKDVSLQALDFDASIETATSPDLGQYRLIHFASHTLLNSRHPELSGIVLSLVDKNGQPQNGFLQAHEIFNLKLNADMVVLSACQTALGKEIRGEGLVGLARAFMYAGAPRVVASLWRVPDRATSVLMQNFYKAMLTEGLPPAAALRKAQLTLRRERRWSAPYYWAGFALQGEWK